VGHAARTTALGRFPADTVADRYLKVFESLRDSRVAEVAS